MKRLFSFVILLFLLTSLKAQWQEFSVWGSTKLHGVASVNVNQVADSNDVLILIENIGRSIDTIAVYYSKLDTVDERGEGVLVGGSSVSKWERDDYSFVLVHNNVITGGEKLHYYIYARYKSHRWRTSIAKQDSVTTTNPNYDSTPPDVGSLSCSFQYDNSIDIDIVPPDSADTERIKIYIQKLGEEGVDSTLIAQLSGSATNTVVKLGALGDETFYYSARDDTIRIFAYAEDEVPNVSAVFADTLATGLYFLLTRTQIDSAGFRLWRMQWAISSTNSFSDVFDTTYFTHIKDTIYVEE